jgi:hypothetical protein
LGSRRERFQTVAVRQIAPDRRRVSIEVTVEVVAVEELT